MEAPYLRITPGHYASIGKKDTLFKDREPSKTIPYSAARTYIAHIGEYPPPGVLLYLPTQKKTAKIFVCLMSASMQICRSFYNMIMWELNIKVVVLPVYRELVSFVSPRELESFVFPRELVSFVSPGKLVSFVSPGKFK